VFGYLASCLLAFEVLQLISYYLMFVYTTLFVNVFDNLNRNISQIHSGSIKVARQDSRIICLFRFEKFEGVQ